MYVREASIKKEKKLKKMFYNFLFQTRCVSWPQKLREIKIKSVLFVSANIAFVQ
jgi:hypothetical protein